MPSAKRKNTTARGLGYDHQKQRERLLARLKDGDLCEWCGQPMTREMELDADHRLARSKGGKRADRLLHASCNRTRGAGDRDPETGAVTLPAAAADRMKHCLLPWY
jgi:hypothetical protein